MQFAHMSPLFKSIKNGKNKYEYNKNKHIYFYDCRIFYALQVHFTLFTINMQVNFILFSIYIKSLFALYKSTFFTNFE